MEFKHFYERTIAPLVSRRMIAFYLASYMLMIHPEIATYIVMLAGFILGHSAVDAVLEKIGDTKKKIEDLQEKKEEPKEEIKDEKGT